MSLPLSLSLCTTFLALPAFAATSEASGPDAPATDSAQEQYEQRRVTFCLPAKVNGEYIDVSAQAFSGRGMLRSPDVTFPCAGVPLELIGWPEFFARVGATEKAREYDSFQSVRPWMMLGGGAVAAGSAGAMTYDLMSDFDVNKWVLAVGGTLFVIGSMSLLSGIMLKDTNSATDRSEVGELARAYNTRLRQELGLADPFADKVPSAVPTGDAISGGAPPHGTETEAMNGALSESAMRSAATAGLPPEERAAIERALGRWAEARLSLEIVMMEVTSTSAPGKGPRMSSTRRHFSYHPVRGSDKEVVPWDEFFLQVDDQRRLDGFERAVLKSRIAGWGGLALTVLGAGLVWASRSDGWSELALPGVLGAITGVGGMGMWFFWSGRFEKPPKSEMDRLIAEENRDLLEDLKRQELSKVSTDSPTPPQPEAPLDVPTNEGPIPELDI